MINLKMILEILAMDDFYGASEDVQIAKGKYLTPMNYKDLKDRIKRA